jgi:hypothetical protein
MMLEKVTVSLKMNNIRGEEEGESKERRGSRFGEEGVPKHLVELYKI